MKPSPSDASIKLCSIHCLWYLPSRRMLYFQSLWKSFTNYCSFTWRFFWLRIEMMDPCFVRCHKSMNIFWFVTMYYDKRWPDSSIESISYLWLNYRLKLSNDFDESWMDDFDCSKVDLDIGPIYMYRPICGLSVTKDIFCILKLYMKTYIIVRKIYSNFDEHRYRFRYSS